MYIKGPIRNNTQICLYRDFKKNKIDFEILKSTREKSVLKVDLSQFEELYYGTEARIGLCEGNTVLIPPLIRKDAFEENISTASALAFGTTSFVAIVI